MTLELPPLFSAFVDAKNAHDSRALAACFTANAVVDDEGSDIIGTAAIEAWGAETSERYRLTVVPTAFAESGQTAVLTALVSGTFDGSPLEFHFHFTVDGGKIASLRTEA